MISFFEPFVLATSCTVLLESAEAYIVHLPLVVILVLW